MFSVSVDTHTRIVCYTVIFVVKIKKIKLHKHACV